MEGRVVLRSQVESSFVQQPHLPGFGPLEPFKSLDDGSSRIWQIGSRAREVVRGDIQFLCKDLNGVEPRVLRRPLF